MDGPGIVRLAGLVLLLVVAAWSDISRGRIPNFLTFAGMGLGFGIAVAEALLQGRFDPLALSFLGWVAGFGIFYIPHHFKLLGRGDVKLMGAVGALQGPPLSALFIFHAIFYISLTAACMALVLLIWQGRLLEGLKNSLRLLVKPRLAAELPQITLPYGVAIAAGTLWAVSLALMR